MAGWRCVGRSAGMYTAVPKEDRLHQLRQWAEQNLLTEAQQARYEELLALVAHHRPTLERLLADDAA